MWSPNGKRLLVSYDYEWDSTYFIFDLDEGKTELIDTELEDYFLTDAVGWVDDRRLVFTTRAGRKKDGTQEYTSGYRSDLAVYDTAAKTYGLITGADDGEFIEGISAGADDILFRRSYREHSSKKGVTHGLMDLSGRIGWEEDLGDVMSIAPSPDGERLAFVVNNEVVIRFRGKSTTVATLLVGDHLKGPFWSPDGKNLLLSFSTNVPRPERPDSFEIRYYTLVITPQPD